MVIQASNIQARSNRFSTSGVKLTTKTTNAPLGTGGLALGGRFTGSKGTTYTKSQSNSFAAHYESAVKDSKGQSEDTPLASFSYQPVSETGNVRPRSLGNKDFMWQLKRYLLEYMENVRNSMLQTLTGHNSRLGKGGQGGVLNLSLGGSQYTLWQQTTEYSYTHYEEESTCYEATGTVVTEDGREIAFSVDMTMSRSFTETLTEYSTSVNTIMTDPLIFQTNQCPASLSDVKFSFDLDCDGVKEEIYMPGQGNAFLVYDKNGDGIINDGSELFGPQSGNGFRDLAVFDSDGNNWIDENDSIFEKLQLWMPDGNGKGRLTSLKAADIGAIYLGYQNTQFSLKQDETNETKGIVRNTGLYLKESGGAGTISHVDMAAS